MAHPKTVAFGKIWEWANSTLARIPASIAKHPDFPFKKGDVTKVELDVSNKQIIISLAPKDHKVDKK